MKKIIIISIVAAALFAACQKDNMMGTAFNVDTQEYETQLNQDYTQANQFHTILLSAKSNGTDDHAAHHATGTATSTAIDTLYNNMMFDKNDSLFSEHFYTFCMDMMQNSGMMSTNSGMMGNNSNMMGSGGMMNGGTMGDMQDMDKMMAYMDSLHLSGGNMTDPDYFRIDSLMHDQMTMCNMMTIETNGIQNIYNNMQTLRKDHQLVH